jgi:hypothetical protein
MAALILTHLGESVPAYLADCVHQFRLWNKDTPIYILLDASHLSNPFWTSLADKYAVKFCTTNSLSPTPHHVEFQNTYTGDVVFRKGYWKHVRERFYFVEECMIAHGLTHVISMEYDVLVYGSFDDLLAKLRTGPQTLRMVKDNCDRGHPAFLYIPQVSVIRDFNVFLSSINGSGLEDMQSLAFYSDLFEVHYFPVLTAARRRLVDPRRSLTGHTAADCSFLSEDSEHFGVLFDSLVVGQWIGGIDSRNTGGAKITRYRNESALYTIQEMPFEWIQNGDRLWRPMLDGRPLMTIHVHSKALGCFLSDRASKPDDDYNVHELYRTLLPN